MKLWQNAKEILFGRINKSEDEIIWPVNGKASGSIWLVQKTGEQEYLGESQICKPIGLLLCHRSAPNTNPPIPCHPHLPLSLYPDLLSLMSRTPSFSDRTLFLFITVQYLLTSEKGEIL